MTGKTDTVIVEHAAQPDPAGIMDGRAVGRDYAGRLFDGHAGPLH